MTISNEMLGSAKIKVLGVGGGGCNAITRMYKQRIVGVDYLALNTDAQSLLSMDIPDSIRIGEKLTKGQGVGGDPEKGGASAEESQAEIQSKLIGADMIFIAAGMGGGTGTGGAPVVAEVAQDTGALTVGVVTKPFAFEGAVRKKKALAGIEILRDKVDTLIVIPNDRLLAVADEQLPMDRAFKMADDVLSQGIRSIAELIIVPGEINLDFADVRAVMDNAGPAWMAIGKGTGPNRAIEAAEQAINSPLLEVEIAGAKGVVFNITGGTDLTLDEVQRASEVIASTVHPDANIIFGTSTDPKMENEVKLTIIATGFPVAAEIQEEADSVARKALEDPASMAIPPFLRHHPAARKRYRNGGMYRDAEDAQPEETPVLADD
jgi:cell division protein FtsZ